MPEEERINKANRIVHGKSVTNKNPSVKRVTFNPKYIISSNRLMYNRSDDDDDYDDLEDGAPPSDMEVSVINIGRSINNWS